MTANAAFAAALMTFLIVAWTAGELAFLAPFKALLFHRHGSVIVGAILLLFLNLCALCYGIARWLFSARHRTQAAARGRAAANGRRTS